MSEKLILVKSTLLHLFRFNLANSDLQSICDDLERLNVKIFDASNDFSVFCDILKLKFGTIDWTNFQNYWNLFPKWVEFGELLGNEKLQTDTNAREPMDVTKDEDDVAKNESCPESRRASYSECDIGSEDEDDQNSEGNETKTQIDPEKHAQGSESPVVEYPDIQKRNRKSTIRLRVPLLSSAPPSVAPKPSVRKVLKFDQNWKPVPESPESPISPFLHVDIEPRPASRQSLSTSNVNSEVIEISTNVGNSSRTEALSVDTIPRDSGRQSDEHRVSYPTLQRVSLDNNFVDENRGDRQSESCTFYYPQGSDQIVNQSVLDERSNTLRSETLRSDDNESRKKSKHSKKTFVMKKLSKPKKTISKSVGNLFN